MSLDWAQQNIIVTGGGTGIGFALAQQMLSRGATVTICGRRESVLFMAKREDPRLNTVTADVTDPTGQDRIFEAAEAHGPVTMLINNAGMTTVTNDFPRTGGSDKEIYDLFNINCVAPLQMTRRMLERGSKGGIIVQIGSIAAIAPLEAQAIYCGTKAGLRHATSSIRRLVEREGMSIIHVDTPGAETPMTEKMAMPKMSTDKLAAKILSGIEGRKYWIKPHFDNLLTDVGMKFTPWIVRMIANTRYKNLRHKDAETLPPQGTRPITEISGKDAAE